MLYVIGQESFISCQGGMTTSWNITFFIDGAVNTPASITQLRFASHGGITTSASPVVSNAWLPIFVIAVDSVNLRTAV